MAMSGSRLVPGNTIRDAFMDSQCREKIVLSNIGDFQSYSRDFPILKDLFANAAQNVTFVLARPPYVIYKTIIPDKKPDPENGAKSSRECGTK
jgi:hypothetical protein